MRVFIFFFLMLFYKITFSQQIVILVKSATERKVIPGATILIMPGGIKGMTDSSGIFVVHNKKNDSFLKCIITHVGFETQSINFNTNDTVEVFLADEEEELESVIVKSTRSSRTIDKIPTRIELISGEELDEKSNMFPSNITMLLRESTGIQVQQTSSVSGAASFRLQGLPGGYTQLLKDGFPIYSGYSSGLSLLQVPPLDLLQVEVIKGSASTLYGGGAIAGLVNLITKRPTDKREALLFLNGTSAGGFDANGYYAQQFRKAGYQLYATFNLQNPFDPAKDGFSALAKQDKININPKFYYSFSEKSKLVAGLAFSKDNRLGGDMTYLAGENSIAYFEENNSVRLASQISYEYDLSANEKLIAKHSLNTFSNQLNQQAYSFGGKQWGSYSEVTFTSTQQKFDWLAGLNLVTDKFEESLPGNNNRNYHLFTTGFFVQNTWKPEEKITIESGLRTDFNKLSNAVGQHKNNWFLLPRLSILLEINPYISSRFGGGMGYKMPTIFNEEAERLSFKNLQALDLDNIQAEGSIGYNADIYFKGRTGDFSYNFNQMFFYTSVTRPLTLQTDSANGTTHYFYNSPNDFTTKGFESQLKIKWEEIQFFGGYTFQITQRNKIAKTPIPFSPRHRLLMTLMYEKESLLKMGFESCFTSSQTLSDGREVRSFWTAGFSAEKLWKKFSLYINFENFTDTRQTKWEPFYKGAANNPEFTEVYAPIDGFIFNGGIKIRL